MTVPPVRPLAETAASPPTHGGAAAAPLRSKAAFAWLALLSGAFGLHRFLLHGRRDAVGWLYPVPTLAGLTGVWRMREFGQDDRLAWLLAPLLGLTLSAAMLTAIVWALMPDERWDARHNGGRVSGAAGWPAVVAAVLALTVGGAVLMGTVAFAGQRFFEWQLAAEPPDRDRAPALR